MKQLSIEEKMYQFISQGVSLLKLVAWKPVEMLEIVINIESPLGTWVGLHVLGNVENGSSQRIDDPLLRHDVAQEAEIEEVRVEDHCG